MGMLLHPFHQFHNPLFGRVNARETANKPETKAQNLLENLRSKRYAEIMGHEQAHQAAAGSFGGGIHIDYDSQGIACGGHVPISIPGLDRQNPEGSLKSYKTIEGAALAPSDPSGQDMAVASHAQALMGKAQVLIDQKKRAQQSKVQKED